MGTGDPSRLCDRVSAEGDRVRVIWPPRVEVCRLTADCGFAETYLPGVGEYAEGVSVETAIETIESENATER